MQDAWCINPHFLNFKTLMSCVNYQASGTRTWPSFQENVLMGAVAGYLLPFQNARFYGSKHFQETYGVINVRHVLDVVLHDGSRPYGALLLMRSPQQGPFTPDERSFLETMIPIFNNAFTASCTADTLYSEKNMVGFALLDKKGKYKSMNEEARRIVWILTHTKPGAFADPDDPSLEQHIEQIVAKYDARIKSGEALVVALDNRWGRFKLSFEREPKTQDTIVSLHRSIPFSTHLAFKLAGLNLPPVRQMVAWLLAHNQSRNEIAQALGISAETATSHIKQIYKAVGISSSHGLLLNLTG